MPQNQKKNFSKGFDKVELHKKVLGEISSDCAMCMFINFKLSVMNERSMFFFKNLLISIVVSL